ncbi:MAG: hypothetical protein ACLRWQ_21350 [Flavonifractor plautii]
MRVELARHETTACGGPCWARLSFDGGAQAVAELPRRPLHVADEADRCSAARMSSTSSM